MEKITFNTLSQIAENISALQKTPVYYSGDDTFVMNIENASYDDYIKVSDEIKANVSEDAVYNNTINGNTFLWAQKEEGYDYLERSFAPMEQWMSFAADEKLEFGDPLIWGDIGIVRGGEELILSDGTREPLSYETAYLFEENPGLFHYAMTAKQGWEWFDGVRGEERFRTYIPRARALNEIK